MCNCGAGRRRVAAAPTGNSGRAVRTRELPPQRGRGVVRPAAAAADPALFNGMIIRDTREWGALLWTVMHSVAVIGGPAITDVDWNELLMSLQTSLPCPDCTAHYTAWLAAHPFSAADVRMWLLNLHNDVNARRGVAVWTEEQTTAAYSGANKTVLSTLVEKLRSLIGAGAVTVLTRMVAALP